MPNKQRVAIIGAGSFAARYHIPALQSRGDCEITAITKRTEATRRMVQERFGIPHGFANHNEMLDAIKPDGVIVCTPHHLHFEHTRDCLLRGIPVLVEKPLTVDADEAEELTRISNRSNVPLLVAYNRRVDPCYREAESIIQQGGIGEIRFIEGRRFAQLGWMLQGGPPPNAQERERWWPDAERPNFRSRTDEMGGGFLDDGGTHIVDAALWLAFSEPERINAMTHHYPSGMEVRTTANIQFKSGLIGSIVSCGDTDPAILHEVIIHGSEGSIQLAKEHITLKKGSEVIDIKPAFPAITTSGHFIDVLNGKSEILCTAESAVTTVRVTRAIFQSAKTGATVNV